MKYCLCCLMPESECCEHKFVEFPDKCFCNKGEWLAFKTEIFLVTPICDNYAGSMGGPCSNCEHDKRCHYQSEID